MSLRPSLLVHGGAWDIPADELEPHRRGVHRAALIGFDVLLRSGSAVDAVQGAVEYLETDESFNAGRGAVLNAHGDVSLDAAIMDGRNLEAGAVANLGAGPHAIRVARSVMDESHHVLLVGEGAREHARAHGIELEDSKNLVVDREIRRRNATRRGGENPPHEPPDTVGAVACDARGHLASASSTGGTPNKPLGRVGDSPIVGAGVYADDRMGAASSTGWGEHIMRLVMAHRAVEHMGSGLSASDTAQLVIKALESRTGGQGGIVVVDTQGQLGYFYNTPHMAYAYLQEGMTEPTVGI